MGTTLPNLFAVLSMCLLMQYTVNSAFDEAKPAWVYAWVESTKDSTKSLGTSPSSASVDHSQVSRSSCAHDQLMTPCVAHAAEECWDDV